MQIVIKKRFQQDTSVSMHGMLKLSLKNDFTFDPRRLF